MSSKQSDKTRPITPESTDNEEIILEQSLRPGTFDEIVGRKKEKENLGVLIQAAKSRGEALDHVLFHGPPGLGKTTFAHAIAQEMATTVRVTSGPAIERQGDLAAILTNLREGNILFIDEIHRLNKVVEEVLYPAMEDYAIDLVVGKGASAKTIRLDLPRFTLIGATTRMGLLSSPLRDRFGVLQRLDFFEVEDLREIVVRAAKVLVVKIDQSGATEIARRSRGTGRIAIRLLKRVRDFAEVNTPGKTINNKIADEALSKLEVDQDGLDELDRKILNVIIGNFAGGPVGLNSIAASLSEEVDTISDVYEPYLIQEGFLQRTPRGRVATLKAFEHLGIDFDPTRHGQSGSKSAQVVKSKEGQKAFFDTQDE